jgi:hypothetical protein
MSIWRATIYIAYFEVVAGSKHSSKRFGWQDTVGVIVVIRLDTVFIRLYIRS